MITRPFWFARIQESWKGRSGEFLLNVCSLEHLLMPAKDKEAL